jgi:hypothetical protein
MNMKLAFLAGLAGILFLLPIGKPVHADECVTCIAKCRECGFLKDAAKPGAIPLSAPSNPAKLPDSAGAG